MRQLTQEQKDFTNYILLRELIETIGSSKVVQLPRVSLELTRLLQDLGYTVIIK